MFCTGCFRSPRGSGKFAGRVGVDPALHPGARPDPARNCAKAGPATWGAEAGVEGRETGTSAPGSGPGQGGGVGQPGALKLKPPV